MTATETTFEGVGLEGETLLVVDGLTERLVAGVDEGQHHDEDREDHGAPDAALDGLTAVLAGRLLADELLADERIDGVVAGDGPLVHLRSLTHAMARGLARVCELGSAMRAAKSKETPIRSLLILLAVASLAVPAVVAGDPAAAAALSHGGQP